MTTDSMQSIVDELVHGVNNLTFAAPVAYVYNPLVYARANYDLYCERYGSGRKEIIFVGMNPGPWGMAQTGVPFGDGGMVRDWLGLKRPVGVPMQQHPKRPIQGFDCPRGEVSGQRLWGWIRSKFKTPTIARWYSWKRAVATEPRTSCLKTKRSCCSKHVTRLCTVPFGSLAPGMSSGSVSSPRHEPKAPWKD